MPYKQQSNFATRLSTRKALERFKPKSWSWDYFMRKVVVLLKKRAEVKRNGN